MKAALSLPLFPLDDPSARLQAYAPAEAGRRSLPRVEWRPRRGSVLHPSSVGECGEVLGLNLAMGCAHQCSFCSARAYPTYPGDEVVALFRDTPERLATELASRRRLPRAVYVSPSTDPFPPLAEVQTETGRVVEVLAGRGVEAWLMTRGYIRPSALRTLAAHRDKVKVTVGLTTLDRALQRVLEPLAAPPRLRLQQIGRLKALGIPVQVALEPLVPGLTDTRANLTGLLEALAALGVRRVTASYVFLRPGIRDNLVRALEAHGRDTAVLEEFEGDPFLKGDQIAAACYLPKARRQRGYAALMALAAGVGISVRICGLTNPDFGTNRMAPAGGASRQRLLSCF